MIRKSIHTIPKSHFTHVITNCVCCFVFFAVVLVVNVWIMLHRITINTFVFQALQEILVCLPPHIPWMIVKWMKPDDGLCALYIQGVDSKNIKFQIHFRPRNIILFLESPSSSFFVCEWEFVSELLFYKQPDFLWKVWR